MEIGKSNPNIYEYCVDMLDDESILIDLAKNNEDEYVRRDAVKKINDETTLTYIAKNDSDYSVRQNALKKISDESILGNIAINANYKDITDEAIENIESEPILYNISQNHILTPCREKAYNKLSIEFIAKTCPHETIYGSYEYSYKEAIEMVDDVSVLADIAKNSDIWKKGCQAVSKIHDESILIDIAKNASEASVRKRAVEEISDEIILVDIAKNDENEFVREAAFEKISGDSTLIYNAKNDSSPFVREAAVKKITDEFVLEDIAKNDSSPFVRKAAVEKANLNQDTIINIANKFKDIDIILMIEDSTIQEDLLFDIAKNGKKVERENAVKYMNNIDNLKYIRDNDSIRNDYEERMDDDGNIHKAYSVYPIREAAKKQLDMLNNSD